jgi:hydrogenase maturation protease
MTPGCPDVARGEEVSDRGGNAPVLVLGLGNVLLGDDGVGPRMVEALGAEAARWGGAVELADGGTLGVALLGLLVGRQAVVILDAIKRGAVPGTIHVLRGDEALAAPPAATTAHEGNAGDLLRAAALLGELPGEIVVLGIEPAHVETGMALSTPVEVSLAEALRLAAEIVAGLLAERPGSGLS